MLVEKGDELVKMAEKGKKCVTYLNTLLEEMNKYDMGSESKDSIAESLDNYQNFIDLLENTGCAYINEGTKKMLFEKIDHKRIEDINKEIHKSGIDIQMKKISPDKISRDEGRNFLIELEKSIESLMPTKNTTEQLYQKMHEAILVSSTNVEDKKFRLGSVLNKRLYYNLLKREKNVKSIIEKYKKIIPELALKVSIPDNKLKEYVLKTAKDLGEKGIKINKENVTVELVKLGKVNIEKVNEKLKCLRKCGELEQVHYDGKNATYGIKKDNQTEPEQEKEIPFDVTDEHIIIGEAKISKGPIDNFLSQVLADPNRQWVFEFGRLSKYPKIKSNEIEYAYILADNYMLKVLGDRYEYER
ncbi:MAG: hypothetical protein JSV92_03705, partial [archaeon]